MLRKVGHQDFPTFDIRRTVDGPGDDDKLKSATTRALKTRTCMSFLTLVFA